MKTLIAIVCLLMFCTAAHATDEAQMIADTATSIMTSASTTCTKDNLTRMVEITYSGEQGKAPCEVHYKKVTEDPTHDQIIYNAQHKSGYCEEKKGEFVNKLTGMGWSCQ